MSIDSRLLKEAAADVKAMRQTKLACACGSMSDEFVREFVREIESLNEEELDMVIKELEKDDRISTHNAFEQGTTRSVCSI